ncbi:hypothetical protein OS493_006899 [Desmophyllum pertusum]|uniref:Uncharacterized protein n=1 Tax=Desmophyllum pertusum TaxID=174260 RepID=A0A9W9ZS68_9CNID|nr:hypothetical protein OS493_006899 [Desmophyllum pertusum]
MLTKLTLLPLDPLAERPATGVDIPDTLEKLVQWEQQEVEAHTTPQSEVPGGIDVSIIDSAAVVNMIKPGTEKTFSGYAEQSFLPYVKAQLRHVKRVDIVWDEYVENSLKATTRSDRGAVSEGASQPIISFHVIGKNFYVSMKTSVNFSSSWLSVLHPSKWKNK